MNGDGSREGTHAETKHRRWKRRRAVGMIPPQEASARRREIEDKLKQVRPGRGRRGGKAPRPGPGHPALEGGRGERGHSLQGAGLGGEAVGSW